MHQQRRLSPAPSSPIQRNQIVTQHSNRLQFLQVTPTPIQYVQIMQQPNNTYQQVDQRNLSRERDNNHINQKGFQSLRLMSQTDAPQSKSPVQQHTVISQTKQSNNLQLYIDSVIKIQREEMHRMFEQQNKQIEYMHQQQQLILQQQQQFQEQKSKKQCDHQLNDIKEQLTLSITQQCRELITKLKKQEQTDFKALQVQIEKIKSQIYQMNLAHSNSISEKLQQSTKGKENETEEYQYKQYVSQRQSIENYDQYIRKYEQFNKQVNDYLVNRKIPDHLSSILNSSKDSYSEIQDVEYIQSDQPLSDITNIQKQQIKRSSQSLQQISQPSKHNQINSQQIQQPLEQVITINSLSFNQNSNQSNDESPIKALNEQMMIDSLDNLHVHDPNNIQLTKEEFDQLKTQRMSTIHENEEEDEELIYQIDENGFVLSQDGHPLIDENGKRIQLSQQELLFYKNKPCKN